MLNESFRDTMKSFSFPLTISSVELVQRVKLIILQHELEGAVLKDANQTTRTIYV